ncbi:hypothetical protein SprV_0702439100 [Sparganum proliferum]
MRINESESHHVCETPSTPTKPNPSHTPSPTAPPTSSSTAAATTNETDPDATDLSCPHCPHTFAPRIGLVDHLRIHRIETVEPVPGAPEYIRRIRLNCPYCTAYSPTTWAP